MRNSPINNHIRAWMQDGKRYTDAIAILNLAQKEGLMKPIKVEILSMGESPYVMEQILSFFQDLLSREKPEKESVKLEPERLPDHLRQLDTQMRRLYGERGMKRGELRAIIYKKDGSTKLRYAEAQAKNLALQITFIQHRIESIYSQLRYYADHGRYLPGTEPMAEKDQLAHAAYLLQEQPQAMNYVAKAKSYQKKHGALQNPEMFREKNQILKEISQFIDLHGK